MNNTPTESEKKKHLRSFRELIRTVRRRTKFDPNTGKEYFDPPLTREECDAMEKQMLEIHHHLLPNPYNLPPPQSCLEALYRIAPESIPPHLRITPEELKKAGFCFGDELPKLQFTPPSRKKVEPLPLP